MEHRLLLGGGEHLLPFARSCITKLKRLGLPYANQSFEIDGVSVKVRIEPGHEYIRIEGGRISMESGAILIGSYSLYSLYTMDSSKLYRPTYTATQYAVDKRQKPKKPAPRDSDVYCRPKPPDVMDEDPFVYNGPYEPPDGGGPLSGKLLELYEKKKALLGTLASRYSGKTRLFVQAILGSAPLRLKVKAGESWLDNCYLLGKSTAIFTDSHGIYWMIRVGYTDVVRMTFSAEGEAVRARLASKTKPMPPAEREREEAYMFSTLKELKPNYGVSEISDGLHLGEFITFSEPSPNEFTLAYSWHFSRNSGKAIQVKHKLSNTPGTIGHLPLFEGQVYRLSFSSGTEKGDAPSISITVGGYSIWSKEGDIALIGQAGGINYAWYPRMLGDRITCDAPMYAFYNAQDEEVIVRFKREASGEIVADPMPDHPLVAGTGGSTLESHSHQMQFVVGVSAGGVSLSGTGQSGIIDGKSIYSVVGGGGQQTVYSHASFGGYGFAGAYAAPNGNAGAPNITFTPQWWDTVTLTQQIGIETNSRETANADRGVGAFIMVSTVDPDCIYIGSRHSRTAHVDEYEYTCLVAIQSSYVGHHEIPPYPPNIPDWTFNMFNSVGWGQKNTAAVYSPASTRDEYTRSTSIVCVTPNHTETVFSESISGEFAPEGADEWAYVFGPDAEFARNYMVIESYNGAAHIMSGVSPFKMELKDGAVENANLFIGYA